jgi:dolichol-phosphate mannosyltransferase
LKAIRAGLDRESCWRLAALAIVIYTMALRLLYAAHVELLPEETYYWNYARHLDIGYLDHPPMVAWLIRGGTALFGDNEFGVRFGALCCGAITSFFVFRLSRNVFGRSCAWVALSLAHALPFFFLSGLLMTPDAPLTAAWAATAYFLERALVADRSEAWLWAGLSLGMGLLSKYTIGLLGIVALSFMVMDVPSRRWLWRWQPYAAAALAITVFSPVIVWNAQHDWASFAFQTSRRLAERPRFSLHKLIGGAMVLITPVGFGALISALTVKGSVNRSRRLLCVALIVPLGIFFLFSLRHEVKLDWTGAPWVCALPLLAHGLTQSVGVTQGGGRGWQRFAWPPMLAVMLAVYGIGLIYLVRGLPGVGYPTHTELVPVAWRDLGGQINAMADDLRIRYGGRVLVVGMDRYAIASEVAFYSNDQAKSVASTSAGHLFDGVGLMYERWFPAGAQAGSTLLLVAWDRGSLEDRLLLGRVDSLDPIEEGTLTRDGSVVRHYYHRVAHGYAFPAAELHAPRHPSG